jgi:hypoxanthine-guanine phosphoribosyltransferase
MSNLIPVLTKEDIDKGFLVGYGLDYAEKFRNLSEVYHLKT